LIIVLDNVAERYEVSYDGLIRPTIKRYNELLGELGLSQGGFQIIIASSIVGFPNGLFEGVMRGFYAYTLYRLTGGRTNGLEIYLGLIHGINFMPILTYKVTKGLTGIKGFDNRCQIKGVWL